MEDKTNLRLTAAEISTLWTQYINDSLSVCANEYFLNHAEDQDCLKAIQLALDTSKNHLEILRDLFHKINFPIPKGFTKEDVDSNAPRIFSDTFILMYLRQMSILGMASSATTLGFITRPDIVDFFKTVSADALALHDLTRDIMLQQGTYVKPPYLSLPEKIDFVDDQQFLTGFFGKKRALTSIEITNLFINIHTNAIGKAIITGFAQTTKHDEVKQYLLRGKKIAQKHIDIFTDILTKQDVPAPALRDESVTNSRTPIFSDRLIMYQVSAMIAAGIGNYGVAMASSLRRDLALRFASLIPEISLYSEDGSNIMIKYGWLEQPPLADDRDLLTK